MKHRISKTILSLVLAATMAIPSNAATTMMNIGTVVADESELEDESFMLEDDAESLDIQEEQDEDENTSETVEFEEQVIQEQDSFENTVSDDVRIDDGTISDVSTEREISEDTEPILEIEEESEAEEKSDASVELSFVDFDMTDDCQSAFEASEALQANTIHIEGNGANYQDTLIDIYFWNYESYGNLPDNTEAWSDYIVSPSDSIQFYNYQDTSDSVILETDDDAVLELSYQEQWRDALHLTTSLSFILPQNGEINADFTVFVSDDTMIEVVADDTEDLFYAAIPIENQVEQEDETDENLNSVDFEKKYEVEEAEASEGLYLNEDDTLELMPELEIAEDGVEYEAENFETEYMYQDEGDDVETERDIDIDFADETELDSDFVQIESDTNALVDVDTDFSENSEDGSESGTVSEFEDFDHDDLFEIDSDILETETEEVDSDFMIIETEEMEFESMTELETELKAEEDAWLESEGYADTEETEIDDAIEESLHDAAVSSYILLTMLNDNVHLNACNADNADAEVRLYFWNYEGSSFDVLDKEIWADAITGPCDISNGEDLAIADLPVTLADGTVGYVHVTYDIEDGSAAYLYFVLPADSSLDVNLTFNIENIIILEAVMGDQEDMLVINTENDVSSDISEDADITADVDDIGEEEADSEFDEAMDDTADFDAAISSVGYDIMPMSVVGSSGLWWFDDYYVGTSNLYYVEETDDFSLKYQLEFHASEDLEANAVQIVIPASIGTYRDGSYILPSDIGVPYGTPDNPSETKSTPFNYYYSDAYGNVVSDPSSYTGDLYIVIWNYEAIDSGTNVMMQILYSNLDIMEVPDGTSWSITPEISVTHNGETEEKEGYTLSGNVDTEVILTSVTKTS